MDNDGFLAGEITTPRPPYAVNDKSRRLGQSAVAVFVQRATRLHRWSFRPAARQRVVAYTNNNYLPTRIPTVSLYVYQLSPYTCTN